jgi:hypothetical protein
LAGVKITLVNSDDTVNTPGHASAWFSCRINSQQVVVDFSDFWNWEVHQPGIPYLKFQSTKDTNISCIPLGPPIVGLRELTRGSSMQDYFDTRKHFQYKPGNSILSQQIPGGNAKERRIRVQSMLKNNFVNVDVQGKRKQIEFWKAHENCLVAVCVPGATENMVDRGQLELMGLGVPTISPRLTTRFVHDCLLEPDIHYIQCKDDYSDLTDIISGLLNNPNYLKFVGNNANEFFNQHYTPEKYWQWILEKINAQI